MYRVTTREIAVVAMSFTRRSFSRLPAQAQWGARLLAKTAPPLPMFCRLRASDSIKRPHQTSFRPFMSTKNGFG